MLFFLLLLVGWSTHCFAMDRRISYPKRVGIYECNADARKKALKAQQNPFTAGTSVKLSHRGPTESQNNGRHVDPLKMRQQLPIFNEEQPEEESGSDFDQFFSDEIWYSYNFGLSIDQKATIVRYISLKKEIATLFCEHSSDQDVLKQKKHMVVEIANGAEVTFITSNQKSLIEAFSKGLLFQCLLQLDNNLPTFSDKIKCMSLQQYHVRADDLLVKICGVNGGRTFTL